MIGKKFTPFPVLKTERLTLRQLSNTDDQEIFALRSNDNINKYLGRKPSQSIDEAKGFIQLINENIEKNDSIYWAITLNGTDKLIGTACLYGFSEDHSTAEIGYELLPGFQGKGIMQEAIAKVIQFGFQHVGLASIEAYTHSENKPSTRLLECLNFKRDSTPDENFILFKLSNNN
ncbi:MAG: family acetyltransferase [Flaviaesturariibacter sp.]|nr:family acetyltransferase [Flaviaesturariibacter sp.]